MNDIAMAQAVQAAVKSKFRGHNTLKSKVITHYPKNLEREYTRITNSYMVLLNREISKNLPTIREAITAEREVLRMDGLQDVISKVFLAIKEGFLEQVESFGLADKIANIANLSRKHKIREWRRVVQKTLGIDIHEDYYMGEFFSEALKEWTNTNVGLITSIPDSLLSSIKDIVTLGYSTGESNTAIGKEIQHVYGVEKRHAQFIARDQVAKLNADLTQAQQKDAGVEEYVWRTAGDGVYPNGRVRECHAELDGKPFSWSDPPEMWYMTKGRGRVYTGRHCHPGEDYQCRCIALPKFNLPGLNLPWYEQSDE